MIGVAVDMTGAGLRAHFNSILDKRTTWLESGNKSGMEGDLDEFSTTLRQIMFDMEEFEAQKKAEDKKKADLKKDLDSKEGAITTG